MNNSDCGSNPQNSIDQEKFHLEEGRIIELGQNNLSNKHINPYKDLIEEQLQTSFGHDHQLLQAVKQDLGNTGRSPLTIKYAYSKFPLGLFEDLCKESFETLFEYHRQSRRLIITVNNSSWLKTADNTTFEKINEIFKQKEMLLVDIDTIPSQVVKFDEVVYIALVQKLLEEPSKFEKVMNLGFDADLLYLKLNEVLINPVNPHEEWIERCDMAIQILVNLSIYKTDSKKTFLPFAFGLFTSNKIYPPFEIIPSMINSIQDYINGVLESKHIKRDANGNPIWPEFIQVQSLFIIVEESRPPLFPRFFEEMVVKIGRPHNTSQINAARDAMRIMVNNLNQMFQEGKVLLGMSKSSKPYQDEDLLRRSKLPRKPVTPRWKGWYGEDDHSGYIALNSREH